MSESKNAQINYVIRDGIAADIAPLLALDHTTHAERVWQMTLLHDGKQRQFTFRDERLPREVEITHHADEARLRLALSDEVCFLVVAGKGEDEGEYLAYLTMRIDAIHDNALVQDVVVGREYRRGGIGTRLLAIARQWAKENAAKRLLAEVPTQNYAAIQFCQRNGLGFCGFNDQYFSNQDIALFFGQSLR